MIKQRKYTGTYRDKKRNGNAIKLEEINQKALRKEGRLKSYRQRLKQYRQNWIFQTHKRKFYQQVGGDDTKAYQQLDSRKPTYFGLKYGN